MLSVIDPVVAEFLEPHARALYRLLNHGDEWTDCRCLYAGGPLWEEVLAKFEARNGRQPNAKEKEWLGVADRTILNGERAFIEWCREWNGKANLYVGRSPRTKDGTVSRVTTYSHDIDPRHPPRTSVTRALLDKAMLAGRRVLQKWPGGYLAESGNGAMVVYRLAIPISENTDSFERWLATRQNEIRELLGDSEIKCDSIHDNERIIKIPGSLSTKGDAENWRTARFVDIPALPYKTVSWTPPKPSTCGAPTKSEPTRNLNHEGETQKARECLSRMSAARCAEYDSWLRVGLALHSIGDAGLKLWEEWSRRSDKYQEGVCGAKWATFTDSGGLTVGSLVYWANQDSPVCKTGFKVDSQNGAADAQTYIEFIKDPIKVEWIAEPIVAKQSISFIIGLPETMKTWIAIDLAVECAAPTSGKWLGLFPLEKMRVMFIEQERPKAETLRRIRAVVSGKGLATEDMKDLFVKCGTNVRINLEPSYQALRAEILKIRPALVVVDSFATFHTGDDSNNYDMQIVMERIKSLRAEAGCAFVFVEHEVKNAFSDAAMKIEPSAIRMKGAVAKLAAIESALTVRRFDHSSSKVYHTKSTMVEAASSFVARLTDIAKDVVVVSGER